MDTTMTLRLSSSQRAALKRRAKAEGKTESAVLRELLARETEHGFDFERVSHLVGSLSSPAGHREKDSWRKTIGARNWRS